MTKSSLIEIVSQDAGIKKKEAEAAINAMFSAIENELTTGGKVQIAGFGTFKVKERAPRIGLNPKTKQQIAIPASKSPCFVPSKTLKELIDKQ